MKRIQQLQVLAQIAFRNLFASRLKTLIVGGIIFFGAILVVVGGSMLDSVIQGMSRSLTGSVVGHLQVYSGKSKDQLSIFGEMGGSDPDLTPIDQFSKLHDVIAKVPNVKSVVPMGVSGALVTSGNTIDLVLSKLRDDVRRQQGGDRSEETKAQLEAHKDHVRQIVSVLMNERKSARELMDEKAIDLDAQAALERASSQEFWSSFDADPLGHLEFLENKIAPQATDADMLFIRYVGTDMDAFKQSFDRLQIVDGTAIPEGKRGFLFAKFFYEDHLKLKNARRLDKIRDGRELGKTIERDEDLKRMVKENTTQVREIVLQLDKLKTAKLVGELQKALGSADADVGKLLSQLFDTNDQNFDERYKLFYASVAPLVDLYRIRVGDTLTIKAFTRSGYMQSVNVKVYGTFNFNGLEKSALSGALNIIDLVSFRELYGYMTSEKKAEIEAIKKKMGATEVARENAEDALFGGDSKNVVADATPGLDNEAPDLSADVKILRGQELADRVYSKEELENGTVLNAAVILEDPKKLAQTSAAIEQAGKDAGIPLKVANWQEASGMLGKMVMMMRLVLFVAVLIIFTVALVIINNAMVMATLERVREIGTMRAIGAQKRFILAMLFVESIVVGLVFSGIGAGVGAAFIGWLGHVGIPAKADIMYFFFSGPRLFPTVATENLVAAFVIVLLVSILSGFYPAWLAMRVSPVTAMQADE